MTISQQEVQRHPLWHDAILVAGRKPNTRPPARVGFIGPVIVAAGFLGVVYWLVTGM